MTVAQWGRPSFHGPSAALIGSLVRDPQCLRNARTGERGHDTRTDQTTAQPEATGPDRHPGGAGHDPRTRPHGPTSPPREQGGAERGRGTLGAPDRLRAHRVGGAPSAGSDRHVIGIIQSAKCFSNNRRAPISSRRRGPNSTRASKRFVKESLASTLEHERNRAPHRFVAGKTRKRLTTIDTPI